MDVLKERMKIIFHDATKEDLERIAMALEAYGVRTIPDIKFLFSSENIPNLKPIEFRKILNMERADKAVTAAAVRHEKHTQRLAIATGALGGVTAVGIPLVVFACLFPPITLPLSIAAGVALGVVGTAAGGTGIATAVMANTDPAPDFSGACQPEDKKKLI